MQYVAKTRIILVHKAGATMLSQEKVICIQISYFETFAIQSNNNEKYKSFIIMGYVCNYILLNFMHEYINTIKFTINMISMELNMTEPYSKLQSIVREAT